MRKMICLKLKEFWVQIDDTVELREKKSGVQLREEKKDLEKD